MNCKTIKYLSYTLDVYEDGKVFRHPRLVITDTGKEYNYKGKWIKQDKHTGGYRVYKFWDNGKHFHKYVHRLVAECFIDNKDSYKEVNHIDGNKTNNHFINLEWCDRAHNVNDYVKKGRGVYGWRKIKQIDVNGSVVNSFNSIEEAALKVNCTASNINMVLRQKGLTAAGYKWKYEEAPKRKRHFKGNIYKPKSLQKL